MSDAVRRRSCPNLPLLPTQNTVGSIESQTRFGIGGVAAGAVIGFLQFVWPGMPLAISVPALLISVAVAFYGFWPWLQSLVHDLSFDRMEAMAERWHLFFASRTVTNWIAPNAALSQYADQTLLVAQENTRRNKAEANRKELEIYNDLKAAGLRQPRNIGGMTMEEPGEIGLLRERLAKAQDASACAQILFNQTSTVLFDDLYGQLADGKLIAKGQRMLNGVAESERPIPPYRW